MAQQNEFLINKVQEQLTELKKHTNNELGRLAVRIEETDSLFKSELEIFRVNNIKPIYDSTEDKLRQINKMQESQNLVLKDLHEKRIEMNKRLKELEKTDFDDKFNKITRKMIADVVRECLTPLNMQ